MQCMVGAGTALLPPHADLALKQSVVSQLLTLQSVFAVAEREGGCTSFILQLVELDKLSSTVKVTQEYAGKVLQYSRFLQRYNKVIHLFSKRWIEGSLLDQHTSKCFPNCKHHNKTQALGQRHKTPLPPHCQVDT